MNKSVVYPFGSFDRSAVNLSNLKNYFELTSFKKVKIYFLEGSFDKSAVSLSNLKFILNYTGC